MSTPSELFRTRMGCLTRSVGRQPLFATTLDSIGKSVLHPPWWGVGSQKCAPLNPGCQVVDYDVTGASERWCALYITGGVIYAYCPPGDAHLKVLSDRAEAGGYKLVVISAGEERWSPGACGLMCVSWLDVVQKVGIDEALSV